MRLNRLLAGLFALVVTAAMPLTAVASADAGTQQSHHAGVASKAKKRTVSMSFAANGAQSFRLYGKVSPKGSNKAVTLLRSGSKNGSFKVFANTRANGKGKYSFNGLKTEGYFIARVTGSDGYRTAVSKPVHVCKGAC